MAMKSHNNECITLINIYDWIKENFAFYRNVDNCWQVFNFVVPIYVIIEFNSS